MSSESSAIRAWAPFYDKIGANILCFNGNDPYSIDEASFLIISFASFEAIRGINPISTFNVYLPAISNFYVVNRVFNNFNRASNAKKMASTLALVNHVSGAFVEIDKNSIISGSYLQGI
jgi:hypothetical protein